MSDKTIDPARAILAAAVFDKITRATKTSEIGAPPEDNEIKCLQARLKKSFEIVQSFKN